MRAPRTPLTTEFRGGYRAVRGRLENLFCPNARRRGGRLIAVVALLAVAGFFFLPRLLGFID